MTATATALKEAINRSRRRVVELPTLVLVAAAYGGWLAATHQYGRWPLWIVAPLTAVLITFHSSLQHEILHGHPTRWRAVNRLLGIVPLSLWLPYDRYRQDHLIHHVNDRLTDPIDDPEAFYVTPDTWQKMSWANRWWLQAQLTLAGRIVLGSFWRILLFWKGEIRALIRNEAGVRAAWLEHLLWCVPVILWVAVACGMPMWIYILAMVVPSNGLLLIRSFAEHRAVGDVPQRTAIVEGSWILGPLFLFNNLHALHHEDPALPWFQYGARYRAERERLLAENGGLLYLSYFDVARRYLFRQHDVLVHPTGRAPYPGKS